MSGSSKMNERQSVCVARRRAMRPLAACVLMVGLAAVLPAGTALAARDGHAGGWKVDPTPIPGHADVTVLASVSCAAGGGCTAVGSSALTLSTPTLTLAERWNGAKWSIQRTPNPVGNPSDEFFAVSCPSATACVAVGDAFYTTGHRTTTLIEAWDGTTWRIQPSPTLTKRSTLHAVSCSSASSCVAAGFYDNAVGVSQALVERWNGRVWYVQSIPRPATSTELFGVSCSSASSCMAVGLQNPDAGNAMPLAESWNGRQWLARTVPLPAGATGGTLDAASCLSPIACTASGSAFDPSHQTLVERWDGTAWHLWPTPDPPSSLLSFSAVELDGVSCAPGRGCVASGEYSPHGAAAYFLEAWTSTGWHLVAAPHPAGFMHGALLGVSCSATRCAAVGAYAGTGHTQVTLAMTS